MTKSTNKSATNKSKPSTKKQPNDAASSSVARSRKAPKYRSFKLQKRIRHPKGPVPSTRTLVKKTNLLIKKSIKPIIGLFLVYFLLQTVFVRAFTAPINVSEVKTTIRESFNENPDTFTIASSMFGLMLTTASEVPTETASVYQSILFILMSLAIIWVFRQRSANNKTSTSEALYEGMYPIIPYVIVLGVMAIQFLPAYIAGTVFSFLTEQGLTGSSGETTVWMILYLFMVLLSVYMLLSSLFATYIVTLPNMRPMQALRSARQLVFSRRLAVFVRLFILVFMIIGFLGLVVVPAIYFIPQIAPWLYALLVIAAFVYVHGYLYTLYRELI